MRTSNDKTEGAAGGQGNVVAHQYATFFVGGMLFGIQVEMVQEIIRYQEMTRVPLSSPIIEGLINLRGQIITAIDLRRRLNIAERPKGELPMNVVVRTPDGIVSLLVDAIGDVIEVAQAQYEDTPLTVDESTRAVVQGVYKLKDCLLLVLDTDRVVDVAAVRSVAA